MTAKGSSEYGIYFGTEIINFIEIRGKKATLSAATPHARIISAEPEQKFPDEGKIVSGLKSEFRKNNISPAYASIALAGEDLIIRTFDLPIFLSRRELKYGAIAFEAKKYIPFKIEELVFDFRLYPDRKNKKILVLFVGIKKEILDKYLSILRGLDIRPKTIEYSGFSILRLLRLAGLKRPGLLGILNVDLEEETNFVVWQNDFPLFSRDITLIPKSETGIMEEGIASKKAVKLSATAKLIFVEKLKSEIRISLDFFRRKFPTKPIDRIIILALPQFQTEISSLIKDLGLSSVNLDISRFLDKNLMFHCPLAKSFATAVSGRIKPRFSINLLKPTAKKEPVAKIPSQALPIAITAIQINFKVVALALLVIIFTLGWGWYMRAPLMKQVRAIKSKQPAVAGVSADQGLEAISGLERELSNKILVMDNVVKDRFYFTKVMNIIPQVLPRGAWLTSIVFQSQEDKFSLTFEGFVLLGDAEKEFAAANDIALGLNNDPEFSQRFKKAELASMERVISAGLEATKFVIQCR
ncbi:MAG: pilus assembly protein PilM [Candidatus Omnitrophota bacterium]